MAKSAHFKDMYVYPPAIALIEATVSAFNTFWPYFLGPVYIYRVLMSDIRSVTDEQRYLAAWVVLAIFGTNPMTLFFGISTFRFLLFSDPLTAYDPDDFVLHKNNPNMKIENRFSWAPVVQRISISLMVIASTGLYYVYIWFRLHYYAQTKRMRRLDSVRRLLLPTLLNFLVYITITLLSMMYYKIVWAWISMNSLFCYIGNTRAVNARIKQAPILVAAITALECFMLAGMVFTALRIHKTLRSVDYIKHRSRIVSFRFFCFPTFIHHLTH